MTTEQILAILRETPDRLAGSTRQASPSSLKVAPEPGEWSVVEVLAHLRSCADMWGGAIETILAGRHQTIKAVNPVTWIKSTDYRALEFGPSLNAFTTQRVGLLRLLERLREEDWSRSATVVGGGAPRELTVHRYATRLALHERAHYRQVDKTVRSLLA